MTERKKQSQMRIAELTNHLEQVNVGAVGTIIQTKEDGFFLTNHYRIHFCRLYDLGTCTLDINAVSYTHLQCAHSSTTPKVAQLSVSYSYVANGLPPVSYTHLEGGWNYNLDPLFAKYDKLQKRHMVHPWADFNDQMCIRDSRSTMTFTYWMEKTSCSRIYISDSPPERSW